MYSSCLPCFFFNQSLQVGAPANARGPDDCIWFKICGPATRIYSGFSLPWPTILPPAPSSTPDCPNPHRIPMQSLFFALSRFCNVLINLHFLNNFCGLSNWFVRWCAFCHQICSEYPRGCNCLKERAYFGGYIVFVQMWVCSRVLASFCHRISSHQCPNQTLITRNYDAKMSGNVL